MFLKNRNYKKIIFNKSKYRDSKNNPKISVVTVVKNGQGHLDLAIKSVINQTYKNIEYIIVDGYSSDNTLSIIEKYKSKINVYLESKDKNMWDAMNKGINVSSGSILVFLNSDDVFTKKALSYAAKYFIENKKIDFLFGTVKKHWIKYGYREWKSYFSFGFYTTHSIGFFAKKKLYLENGGYDAKFLSADLDFFLRIIFKKKFIGTSSKKNELFGYFKTGGFSSKISYRNHLYDLNKIRINNNQSKILVYIIFFIKIFKKPIKFLFNRH